MNSISRKNIEKEIEKEWKELRRDGFTETEALLELLINMRIILELHTNGEED